MSANQNLSGRLLSLDFFRGLVIALRVFISNPGSRSYFPGELKHSQWNGLTLADSVFPFFLFIVGVSMAFSKRLGEEDKIDSLKRVTKRACIIFALGLFLNFFPAAIMDRALFDKFDLLNLRIPGVLQRIALCYFFAALVVLNFKRIWQYLAVAALLVIYWALLYNISVPGYGKGDLSLEGNVCGYLDRMLIGPAHLYVKDKISRSGIFDPEGIISTLPAIATTLFGYFAGRQLKKETSADRKMRSLFIFGGSMVFTGFFMSGFLPMNKQLWTSSYAVFTGGLAAICLAACYFLIDLKKMRFGIMPMVYLGSNAIVVFAGTALAARFYVYIIRFFCPAAGGSVSLKNYIYQYLLVPRTGCMLGSLLFAGLNVLLWVLLMRMFYKSSLFLKI